jgi:hypothetical protein
MQEKKSEQHREWLPADARKAHGCAICAAALPAQKRGKNFLKKFKKMLDKWCRNPYTNGAPFEMHTTWRYSSVG